MAKLGSYRNITVEMKPDDAPKETLEKARSALQQAKAQVGEKKRREEVEAARKRQSFFRRIFG